MFVSAPGDANGKIHYYRRTNESNNLAIDSTIELSATDNLLSPTSGRFGESISILKIKKTRRVKC